MRHHIYFKIPEIIYYYLAWGIKERIYSSLNKFLEMDPKEFWRWESYLLILYPRYNKRINIRRDDIIEDLYNEIQKKHGKIEISKLLRMALVYYHVNTEKIIVKALVPRDSTIQDIREGKRLSFQEQRIPELYPPDNLPIRDDKVFFYLPDFECIKRISSRLNINPQKYLSLWIMYSYLKRRGKNNKEPSLQEILRWR